MRMCMGTLDWMCFTLAVAMGLAQSVTTPASIAYIAPSRQNQQIRLITLDGSGARTLWSVPPGTAPEDGPGTLSWRPDGRAITFDSSHDFARSTMARDLYTVSVEGGSVIRPTSMPEPSAFASMQKGGVRVQVRNASFEGRELSVYIEGAAEPVRLTAAREFVSTVTFPRVADFGPGVRQYVRVLDLSPNASYPCWMDVAAFADVKPGATVDAGILSPLNNTSCAMVFGPSWRADGQSIAMWFREPTKTLAASNNLWRIAPAPKPGPAGERVFDASVCHHPQTASISPRCPPAPTRIGSSWREMGPLTRPCTSRA